MYKVYADGSLLFATGNPSNENHAIIDPVLTTEINTAGELSFTVPKSNELYNDIKLRLTTIEVYRSEADESGDNTKDEIIWRGRPIHVKIGFNGHMQVTCEGSLANLNDTIYPPDTSTMRLGVFLQKLIENHNETCDETRKIHVGLFTMDDVQIEYNGSDTSTMEVLKNLVETYGGYIVPHETDGGSYFDWLKQLPQDDTRPIDLSNVINVERDISAENICTCVIPIGKDDLRIGSGYIENRAAVALFGKVWQAVTFSDIEDADALYIAGEQWLGEKIWSSLQLDVTAAQVGKGFDAGVCYPAHIAQFGIDHILALTSKSIQLDDIGQTSYTFSAATIWTQINVGRNIAEVMDSAQRLQSAASKSLSARTAAIEKQAATAGTAYSGKVEFSDGTSLNFTKGLCTGGHSSEGDF